MEELISIFKDIRNNIQFLTARQFKQFMTHRTFSQYLVEFTDNNYYINVENFLNSDMIHDVALQDNHGNLIPCEMGTPANDSFKVKLPFKPDTNFDLVFTIQLKEE